jgi:hypothetical protein
MSLTVLCVKEARYKPRDHVHDPATTLVLPVETTPDLRGYELVLSEACAAAYGLLAS